MICELCGKQFNSGVKIELEGSVVNACESCSSSGTIVSKVNTVKSKPKVKPQEERRRAATLDDIDSSVDELVVDYGARVKKAREKRKLKQAELGKLINEHESVIHRIESSHLDPSDKLIKKLEKVLDIKLMEKSDSMERMVGQGESKEATLGDVVIVRKKGDK